MMDFMTVCSMQLLARKNDTLDEELAVSFIPIRHKARPDIRRRLKCARERAASVLLNIEAMMSHLRIFADIGGRQIFLHLMRETNAHEYVISYYAQGKHNLTPRPRQTFTLTT